MVRFIRHITRKKDAGVWEYVGMAAIQRHQKSEVQKTNKSVTHYASGFFTVKNLGNQFVAFTESFNDSLKLSVSICLIYMKNNYND